MATKIKNRKKKGSKFPDKSPWARGREKGIRDTCDKYEETIEEIKQRGYEDHTMLTLYILKSKYHSSDEDIMQLHKDMVEHQRWIAEGKLTLQMIQTELQNVYDVEFEPCQKKK